MKKPKTMEIEVQGYVVLCDGQMLDSDSEVYDTLQEAKDAVEQGNDNGDYGDSDEITIHPIGKPISAANFNGIQWNDNPED